MSDLHIHPTGYRVIVKPDEIETETASGIVLVQDEKLERAGQQRGTLVAVGKEAWKDDSEPFAEVGDWILYSRYAGRVVEDPITDEQYWIMNDEDVLCVLDREAE